jgi:twitching motility protein PilT
MKRLDFYVQHMLRQSASAIVMHSGDPVEFHFSSGKTRKSNQPISHKQVMQLVREAAPPETSDVLRKQGRATFTTDTEDGSSVYVRVDSLGPERWRVLIGTSEAAVEQAAPPEHAEQPEADEWDAFPQEPAAGGGFGLRSVEPPPAMGEFESTFADQQGRPKGRPPPPQPQPQRGAARPDPAARPEPPAKGRPPPPTHAGASLRPAPPPPTPHAAPARPARAANPAAEARLQKLMRIMLQLRASDLHVSSGAEPMIRVDGEMRIMEGSSGVMKPDEVMDMMMAAAPEDVRNVFEDTNDADFAYEIENYGRFRLNYFMDRRGPALVARQIPLDVVSPEHLGLPQSVVDLCWLSKGLVLVTGPTGSGKSTTLASLLDFINRNRADHIITIEDPIEYVHGNKRCLVNQRQVGIHTASFSQALRAALREDPDIVVVGEMRDLETISIAIETAETGHLVFGTLHTTTAPSTVDRIIDQFPAEEQSHIRSMLAESLRGVVSQVLVKKSGGGRVAAYEVLISNSASANLIREGKTFQLRSIMQTGRHVGMQTMNDHLFELVKTNQIEPRDAYIKAYDKVGLKEMLQKARIALDPSLIRGEF